MPPSVAIEQRVTRGGGKSTVATVTEVYHFLRLLFAKLGTQYCPNCHVPVQKQSEAAIIKQVEDAAKKGRVRVLAPLIKARKGFHTEVAAWAVKHGFDELWVDGAFRSAHGFAKLERFREHTIDVVVGEVGGARKKAASADKVAAIVNRGKKLKNASVSDDPREIVKRALNIGKGTARIVDAKGKSVTLSTEMSCPECRMAFEELDPRLFSYNSPHGWCPTCRGFGVVWRGSLVKDDDSQSAAERELAEERATQWLDEDDERPCPECQGARLNAIARNVRVRDLTIDSFARLPVSGARAAATKFKFKGTQALIATDILDEIRQRLTFMEEVGLGYLALDRSAKTLSGGETQRIRLSAQLGSNLRGVLYVLDEPTIGLHPRDNNRLLDTLEALRSKGNSLIIVEHDDETMRRADHIVDLGPGPGVHGGEVVAQGTLAEIEANPQSITGRHLKDPIKHPMNGTRRPIIKSSEPWIELSGASANNLQDVDVKFPVGRLTVITGISGSGKSSLMRAVLLPAAQQALAKGGSKRAKDEAKKTRKRTATWTTMTGAEHLEAVYEVDQSPIGKTSRSTPATYVGVLDEIRALFAQLPLSRIRGYTNSRFSFNNEGGRCETCLGQGVIKHEMSFLPTSYVPCEDCGGLRYNAQTLEVLYNDKSIGQVLQLTIEQAAEFFGAVSKIRRPLGLLSQTGLGYLKLGQPSPTLSGGEAQRLKLVTELTRGVGADQHKKLRQARKTKSTLYLLEEPTVGLHMADVEQLLKVLHRLTDEGNTVVVIEHHISVIAEADYLVDIGPEAGEEGGKLVAAGTPEQVARHKVSRIAPFLRDALKLAR